jgi:small-conductance mechanosensitive channel
MVSEMLDYTFWDNTVRDYLVVLAAVVGGIIVVRIAKFFVVRRIVAWAKKKETPLDADLVKSISKTLLPVLYLGTVYVAVRFLTLPENVARGVELAGKILLAILGARLVIAVLAGAIKHYWLPREGDAGKEKTVKALLPIIKIAVWIVAAIFLLDNLGFKISAVVAGLGIGGVAVALAGQAILKDLFSYFAILFDRPFEIGDQIAVGDKIGTVEKVGVKTTRLKSVGGEQLIFSNADLTDSRVQNFKRMDRRRIATLLGVTYETPAAKLQKIPALIQSIIDPLDGVDFDRAHFASFGDFSLVFEVVYFVQGNDYKKYMDIQEDINYRMYEAFAKEKIEFAYPTQTVYLPPPARARGKK